MSLLMKALQQAAQNRNPSGIDPAPTEGADGPALSFEPMAGRERPAGTGPEAWGGGFEAPRAGTAGRATATADRLRACSRRPRSPGSSGS